MAEVPVTRLFRKMDNPSASVEDALIAIKADFEAEKQPVYIKLVGEDGKKRVREVPGYAAVVKKGTNEPLSIMGDRYGVIQYKTALDFLNDMIGNQEVEIYAAAAVENGRKLHFIVKAPEYVELGPGDRFECFFTVSASHDGTGCLQAMCSPIHSVAQTVFTPLGGSGIVKIKHTAKVEARLALARRMLGKLRDSFGKFGDNIEEMAGIKLTDQQAIDYFHSVVGGDSKRAVNVRDHMYDIYKSTGLVRHIASCKDTLFGCFMAVQQQADYYKTVRKSLRRSEVDARIEARLTGDGAKMKALAYSEALLLLQKFGK